MNVNYSKSCNIVMVTWSENRQKLFNLSLLLNFPYVALLNCYIFLDFEWVLQVNKKPDSPTNKFFLYHVSEGEKPRISRR